MPVTFMNFEVSPREKMLRITAVSQYGTHVKVTSTGIQNPFLAAVREHRENTAGRHVFEYLILTWPRDLMGI